MFLRCMPIVLLCLALVGCLGPVTGEVHATEKPVETQVKSTYQTFDEPYTRIDIDKHLYAREVQTHAYVITQDEVFDANSMLVEMADGSLVLVDTPYTPEATKALLAWIKETFPGQVLIEINTGWHDDNLAGNGVLLEAGVPVYGADRTVELLKEHDSRNAPPDHLYPIEEGLTLEFGAEQVQVYFPGPTHTLDNVIVYFPSRRLMFGGCMVTGWGGIGNVADADVDAWPDSLRNLSQFDSVLVIPGHGNRFDPGNIEETIQLLEAGEFETGS